MGIAGVLHRQMEPLGLTPPLRFEEFRRDGGGPDEGEEQQGDRQLALPWFRGETRDISIRH
jgi:hypothetical protein